MIIKDLQLSTSSFTAPLVIHEGSDPHEDEDRPWITVLIGRNGSRKSLALRLLLEAGLGSSKYRSHGHAPLALEWNFSRCNPSNVIAISNTPWDRFPRAQRLGRLSRLLAEDTSRFVYIGQRAGTGNVTLRNNEIQLGYSLVENSGLIGERAAQLQPIFAKIGLALAAGVRLQAAAKLCRHQNEVWRPDRERFEAHLAALPELIKELRKDRSISKSTLAGALAYAQELRANSNEAETLWALLEMMHPSKITFWLRPEGHTVNFGYRTVVEWKNLLHLGFVEIQGISFSALASNALPAVAKDARRDSDLSSGQWNWLYNFSNLALELRDNSLVLIDEPENSLHPGWQREYLPALESLLRSKNGCHAVIATHSALIASGLSADWGNLRLLEPPGDEHSLIKSTELDVAFAWSADDVYQDVFGLPSSRAPRFIEIIDDLLSQIARSEEQSPYIDAEKIAYLEDAVRELPPFDAMRNVVAGILRRVRGQAHELP